MNKNEFTNKLDNDEINLMLIKLGESFEPFLYASNKNVVGSLIKLGYSKDEVRRIELFDWFQGVGLYGFFQLYKLTGNTEYVAIILNYFKSRIDDGLPAKNINSMAPMLTLISMIEAGLIPEDSFEQYNSICREWASELYLNHPRTHEGGMSHMSCESANEQELWDDTLFMSVLFLAKAGMYYNNKNYVEEAIYQFLIHTKYLVDSKTGLWFHGWTFEGNHNFTEAKWARGNSWITIFVPVFIEICNDYELPKSISTYLEQVYFAQVEKLCECQLSTGLWPTLLDDSSTYEEASASAGFLFGILKGINTGLYDRQKIRKLNIEKYIDVTNKGIKAIVEHINGDGILEKVSGGTAMGKDSQEYYKNIPLLPKPYGQAMAMLALVEYLKRKEMY